MVSQYGNTYFGLSTDTKPSGTSLNGRAFVEMDTSKLYFYDAANETWYEWTGGSSGSDSEPK